MNIFKSNLRIFSRGLIFALLICSIGQPLSASPNKHKMAVSANVLSLPFGEIALKYDYSLNEYMDLTIPFVFQSTDLFLINHIVAGFIRSLSFGLFPSMTILTGAGVRFKHPESGWYLEPILELGFARIDYSLPTGTQNLAMFKPKIMFGYLKSFASGFYVNAAVGLAGRIFFPMKTTPPAWQPDATVALGYSW